MSLACVMITDVSGSTALYERLDNARALEVIDGMLTRMRTVIEDHGGQCVKARGDDILSFFDAAPAAFDAARAMVDEPWDEGLTIHAGIYFGEILSHDDDIYGNAVNTAARLAALAKTGEILLGQSCFADLDAAQRARCVDIGALPLRGKDAPTRIFACSVKTLGEQTMVGREGRGGPPPSVFAAFSAGGRHWHLEEGGRLRIGRARGNDIVLDRPTVSRNHGAVAISGGQLEFTDHSSTGSLLKLDNGHGLTVHRRTTLVSGGGTIRLGQGEPGEQAVLVFSQGKLDAR